MTPSRHLSILIDLRQLIVYRRFTMNISPHPRPPTEAAAVPPSSPATEPMDPEILARICKALGHPARVRIVQFLLATNRCICGEIVNLLPLAQSTVSQHLKLLKQSGLIKGEVEGPRTCYCIDHAVLDGFRRAVAALLRAVPRHPEKTP